MNTDTHQNSSSASVGSDSRDQSNETRAGFKTGKGYFGPAFDAELTTSSRVIVSAHHHDQQANNVRLAIRERARQILADGSRDSIESALRQATRECDQFPLSFWHKIKYSQPQTKQGEHEYS